MAYIKGQSEDMKIVSDILIETLDQNNLILNEEGFIRWENSNPKHPRNWSLPKKAYNTLIILLLEFLT